MKILLIFLILFFNFTLSLKAQQRDFAFKNVTIHEGLSQNSVVDIVQDPVGFIWFATQDGLNRFDGKEFMVFPKLFDDITTHEHSQLGKLVIVGDELWMITRGGRLEKLDLFTHEFTLLSHLGNSQTALPPLSDLFVDTRGDLWIGTLNDGLYQYKPSSGDLVPVESFPVSNSQIQTFYEDKTGGTWAATKSSLIRMAKEKTETYLEGVNVHVVTEDAFGNTWVGTLSNGLHVKMVGNDQFQPFVGFANASIPSDLIVEAIHGDNEGNLWVGTYGKGLYVLHLRDSSMTNLMPDIRNPFSIGFQDILSIYQDRKGGIWIGTDGGGVSYYEKQFNNFQRITNQNVSKEISIEQIRAIATDTYGNVWIGTSGQGLTQYTPATKNFETVHFEPLHSNVGNPNRVVSLYSDREDDLWVGTQDNGLIIRDGKTNEIKKWFSTGADSPKEKIPDNTIWCITENGEGQFWIGTRRSGLLLIDKKEGLKKSFPLPSKQKELLDGNSVRSILRIDEHTLALGFEKAHGVQLLDINTGKFKNLEHPRSQKMVEQDIGVKCLYHHDGWLWIGTAGYGIVITSLESGRTIYLDEGEGLPNNMIYGLLPESDSVIWASSNKGLFSIHHSVYPDSIGVDQISAYSVADGLQSTEFNTGAYHLSEGGTMYFGGISGLNYFHPGQLVFTDNSLDVVIKEVMVGNSKLESDTLINFKNQLNLKYFQNSISFNYSVLDFVSPEKRKYFYKLVGYDEEWVEAGNRNYAAFTNLLPGDYQFTVKSAENVWEEAPVTTLDIAISYPFWLEWWFVLIVIVCFILLLYGLYRFRVNQILHVQQVKNTISADLHDELGSRLTNIQLLSAISKNNLNGSDPLLTLGKIEIEAQSSAEALDEIVWNINKTDESLMEIVARMRRYASDIFEEDKILCHFEVSEVYRWQRMCMQKRREFFLIFKELLTNVRKHAKASHVDINIIAKNGGLTLEVKDNGVGIDFNNKHSRNGLRNIGFRMEKWKGKMEVDSEPKQGTKVMVWLPFECSWVERILRVRNLFQFREMVNIPLKGD